MRTTARHDNDTRKDWQTPAVQPVGRLGEVIKGGQGKVTVITGDPGEPQKVPSHEDGQQGSN